MAQSNTQSTSPHSLSLKVLRLSRPSLATQTPLPPTSFGQSLDISPQASLAHPSAEPSSTSPLTPLLTLPASFGAAYVGETFACTLCVNNELSPPNDTGKSITAVRIAAELQTPSNTAGIPLELATAFAEEEAGEAGGVFPPAATLQKTLSHDLKEAGAHVLAVTISYTETSREGEVASGGRARSFRKLYQFVAQPVLAVRSKVSSLGMSKENGRKWMLEAQVENVGEEGVVVERVWLNGGSGIEWSGGVGKEEGGGLKGRSIVLKPRDVEQVMFVVRDRGWTTPGGDAKALAQVDIDWTSAMGEKGKLMTGWLSARA
jgi:trafficking protein particle complex subunit 13